MYDFENALSHRDPTYYSIGIPVVLKLKLPPQQHKLKYKVLKLHKFKKAFI